VTSLTIIPTVATILYNGSVLNAATEKTATNIE
jgi:hypothetical protein